MSEPHFPVFYEPFGNRWRRVKFTLSGLGLFVAAVFGIFAFSVVTKPALPDFSIRSRSILHSADPVAERRNLGNGSAPPVAEPSGRRPITVGFYVNYDDTSYASLKRNIGQIDWLSPEWIRLSGDDAVLKLDIDQKATDLIKNERPGMPVLPLVQNYKDEKWNSELLAAAVRTEESRARLLAALDKVVADNGFGGLTIDLEEVPKRSQADLFAFMRSLYADFHSRGLIVAQAVPFDNPDWDYRAYAEFSDYLMLMAYDQHWATGKPGPVAAETWFDQTLAKRMKDLDPAKTIVGIGNYGYDWSNKEPEAKEVSFQESVLSARDSEARIAFDDTTRNPNFSYDEDDGSHHSVWFLDAATAFNEIRSAEKYKPFGFALWRLGSEDPSLWNVFGGEHTSVPDVASIKTIRYGYDIDFEGKGEILQVVAEPRDGKRDIDFDGSGSIDDEAYTAIPSSYVIQRSGDHPGEVALTFDDGPDPTWTPQILDELKKEGVPATFFIVGNYGQENPDLVRRIVEDGHDIGNHSFTHPNLGEIPARVTDFEINATQRLIESAAGRSTTLFRAPYFGDAEPQTSDEVEPIVEAKRLGYITVGLHVDPDDWQQPGAETIARRTIDGITNQSSDEDVRGQVVLLHDGGGDRSQTLAALPMIIRSLREQGYKFVTVSELAGIPRDTIMPPVAESDIAMTKADTVAFGLFRLFEKSMEWLFVLGIVLGTLRLVSVAVLAYRARRRETEDAADGGTPFVSVIVPAHNEESVIAKTVASLLGSSYPNFEVIVVDDGSTDETAEAVRRDFGDESRVRVFRIENGGKARALDFGLRHASGEIIVGLDADTVFAAETIGELARAFRSPEIGAVAGNAKVGNRLNIVTKWQALEYVTSQNLDRRAMAGLNAITVVPGAVGAWRREALEAAGGFASNTIAEDQDLTLRVRMLGYRIAYADRAVAYTEAPDTLRGLARQRFRWSYGTLQCMWKHRRALFNRRFGALGLVAMPNVWLFQILFPLVSPFMDLMFVWTVAAYALQRAEHPGEFLARNASAVVLYYSFFLLVDLSAALVGFAFEPDESRTLAIWMPLQRFGYRQVMYSVMLRSVANALKGVVVGWNKVERRASVSLPEAVGN